MQRFLGAITRNLKCGKRSFSDVTKLRIMGKAVLDYAAESNIKMRILIREGRGPKSKKEM